MFSYKFHLYVCPKINLLLSKVQGESFLSFCQYLFLQHVLFSSEDFVFYEDFFAQKLLHKVVFSLVAWAFFGVLLWGRQVQGWRGKTAIRWTWAGFIAILLGYVGSKVVLEFLLV